MQCSAPPITARFPFIFISVTYNWIESLPVAIVYILVTTVKAT